MNEWQLINEIKYSGTTAVFSGSTKAGDWLAAPAGLYRSENGRWRLVQKQIPFWHLNSVAVFENMVLAAGLPHGIVRSATRGDDWRMAWTEQTQQPISCLTPSPNTARDGVWLAGTQGDGILRSTDNGRHWELANWGLQEFAVLDIVTAPRWGEREYAFALTLNGVYQSPNGGRAWRFVGEPFVNDPPTACAVSANFDEDQTVWLTTEAGAFFESTDRGRTWQQVETDTDFGLLNHLLRLPNGDLLAAGNGVWRSGDNGRSWQPQTHPPLDDNQQILRLSLVDETVYAALLNGGAWRADDGGATWTAVSGLNSGRFMWLAQADEETVLGSPTVGLWRIADGEPTQFVDEGETVLALAQTANGLLISKSSGVYLDNQLHSQPAQPLVNLCAVGDRLWGVDENGRLYQQQQEAWQPIPLPAPVIALDANEDALAVAMADRGRKEIAVGLQRHDEPNKWHKMTDLPSSEYRAQLSLSADNGVTLAAGRTARTVQWPSKESETAVLADKAAPLTAIAHSDAFGGTAVCSIEKLWLTIDNKQWNPLPDLPDGDVIADLAFQKRQDGWRLLALSADGRVWEFNL